MQEQKRTFKYGDVFHVAGLDWIVLRTTPAPTPGCSDLYFCEATEDVFQAPFDENDCNDWNKASLRKRLNGEFLDNLIAECVPADPRSAPRAGALALAHHAGRDTEEFRDLFRALRELGRGPRQQRRVRRRRGCAPGFNSEI